MWKTIKAFFYKKNSIFTLLFCCCCYYLFMCNLINSILTTHTYTLNISSNCGDYLLSISINRTISMLFLIFRILHLFYRITSHFFLNSSFSFFLLLIATFFFNFTKLTHLIRSTGNKKHWNWFIICTSV